MCGDMWVSLCESSILRALGFPASSSWESSWRHEARALSWPLTPSVDVVRPGLGHSLGLHVLWGPVVMPLQLPLCWGIQGSNCETWFRIRTVLGNSGFKIVNTYKEYNNKEKEKENTHTRKNAPGRIHGASNTISFVLAKTKQTRWGLLSISRWTPWTVQLSVSSGKCQGILGTPSLGILWVPGHRDFCTGCSRVTICPSHLCPS